ncbi:D-alanyl-D-alanine carboxypeptidase/D-alanyl-D-alanine endopeptidase [Aestuariimicrobium sp. T2.26MG-19.2B]|uniref:D-alanyl-D-alanine carboxypeptidase/D-alanyl-D-alanine endopeptidase n=1 Tax=Aestuariimicrobium sp. T2.26MG-19.2B TaxID=3040679 RepID=UPI002477A1E0|nr:D-alanyl-D-alanine carboxypeptidase/D-alanyl-D-alanine-endopeptidase [Aestuariimicrobium sp. T2.26MG-19.2B]CAI9404921.1 hypothetical protein AESSP_01309 [Aestuariimicrobium sp. T2.26MG-19.2B]
MRRSSGTVMGLSLAGLVVGIVITALIAFASPIARSTGLRSAGLQPSTIAPSIFAPPTPSQAAGQQSGDGVVAEPDPITPSATLASSGLLPRIDALKPNFKGRSSVLVVDHATGRVLVNRGGDTLMIPASNLKTLVMLATLQAWGPDHRFTTTVASSSPGHLVLVGGGDPYLERVANPNRPRAATTAQLAAATAARLKQQGVTSVTLGYDASLFSGPAWHPTWPADYSDQVARISALSLGAGRTLDATGARVPGTPLAQDPARQAATAFAQQLKAAGITVTGAIAPTPAPTTGTGEVVASVSSMPLIDIATEVMVHSDNFGAEVLFRQLALAQHRPASFVGGAEALRAVLTGDGLWRTGAVATDGSGLSRSNRVSARMLALGWQHISSDQQLQGLLVSTPIAGVSGTLTDRFSFAQGAQAGRGWVHGKTGTLTGVSSLSGWTVTADGQPVVLAVMVNDSKNDWFARVWIDQVAATVTGCGCR